MKTGIPRGTRWTCRGCGIEWETPSWRVPQDLTCEECAGKAASEGCDLPEGSYCRRGFHVAVDEAGVLSASRCPKAVLAEHRKLAAAFRGRTFATFESGRQPEMYAAVRCWASGTGSVSVVLVGPTGAGKSHLLEAARITLMGRGLQVAWVSRTELALVFNSIRSMGLSPDHLSTWAAWKKADALILDDLGQEPVHINSAPEVGGLLCDLLDERPGLLLGVASNLNREQLLERYGTAGPALVSRLYHGATVPAVRPDDYRVTSRRHVATSRQRKESRP